MRNLCLYYKKFLANILACCKSLTCRRRQGRRWNVYKTFRRRPGCLMYVQFTSCATGLNYYVSNLELH